MSNHNKIRTFQSCATDVKLAVQEFHAELAQQDMALVVFFCSSEYDLDLLATEMRRLFAGVQVVGCTTAGEIGPAGYCQHSLTGVAFPEASCIAVSGLLDQLNGFDITRGHDFAQSLLQQLERNAPNQNPNHCFALLLIDGMCGREERVAHALQYALGKITLFGGSAGDDQKFAETYVYSNGYFHTDSAVMVLVNTPLPFKIFKTHHFVSTDERFVVTEADPAKRIVKEINGLPAAVEYARLVCVGVSEFNAKDFAFPSVVVKIGGTDYVRSIQKANADGSLTFYCAIETGLVLRVAHSVNLVDNLEQTFDAIRTEIGPTQLILGCDCILRNLEVAKNGLKDRVMAIFRRNNTLGFSSYGEQFRGIHNNQTFTGCAFGSASGIETETHDG
ncbi:MAG: FIST C-terminal domain-containing protein [Methylobacter sp.]|nr:FIST C-terminal domain-containing protein [Methylobacter sp.]